VSGGRSAYSDWASNAYQKTAELVNSGAYEAAAGSCYVGFRCLAKTCKEHEDWSGLTIAAIQQQLGIKSKSTVYRLLRLDGIENAPNGQMKHSQLSRQKSANCRVKIRPTVVSKYGQLAHLLQKNSGI